MKHLYFLHGDGGAIWRLLASGPCEIYAIGASVTVQKDGWADRFTAKLCRLTGHDHFLTKNAMGGVGILFGAANYKSPSHGHPRVTILEFSTGDLNLGLTPIEQLRPLVSYLLSRAIEDKSLVAIVHNWRSDFESDDSPGVRRAYNEIARAYSVPVIENQRLIETVLQKGCCQKEALYRDNVHTNSAGAELCAEHIAACFSTMLGTPPIRASGDFLGSSLVGNVRIYELSTAHQIVGERWTFVYPGTQQMFPVVDVSAESSIQLLASGQLLGAAFIAGPRSGWASLLVDGGVVRNFRCFDKHSYYDRYVLFPCFQSLRESVIEIKQPKLDVDYKVASQTHPDYLKPRLLRFVHFIGIDLCVKNLPSASGVVSTRRG